MLQFMVIQALERSLTVDVGDDGTQVARPFPLFLLCTESSKPSYIGQRSDIRRRFNFSFLLFVSLVMWQISTFEINSLFSLEFRYYIVCLNLFLFRLLNLIILIICVLSGP